MDKKVDNSKMQEIDKLEKESDDGNVEYKLKLIDKTNERIENLISQMRYRCQEGFGECIYNLGVADDGTMIGLTNEEYEETINTLKIMAKSNNYSITNLTSSELENNKKVYEVLFREHNDNKYIEVKIAVAGAVDSGKSTTMGTLISGKNDDGRGSSRLSIFNYSHEIKSGRTSSIAHHIIGFNNEGKIMNYSSNKITWPEIVQRSSKIISFFDLAGHEKYLKTTILGLSSSFPDICFIIIGANMGISKMTKEHIFICITLKIPFVIILTKIDICDTRQNVLEETVQQLNKLLKFPGIRRIPITVRTIDDVVICAKNIYSESIVPVFHISNVTGLGIDRIKQFLNLVGKKEQFSLSSSNMVEYYIDNTFSVSGVGTVTGGHLVSGTIRVGDKLLLGPNNGSYETVAVRSIHCKRVPLQIVSHGCYVCLGLKKVDRNHIRKGNVLISLNANQLITNSFKAEINILRTHSATIRLGYQAVLHSSAIRQTIILKEIIHKVNARNPDETVNDGILRTGDKATVLLQFRARPEYLKSGARILLCEGKCKITGMVL